MRGSLAGFVVIGARSGLRAVPLSWFALVLLLIFAVAGELLWRRAEQIPAAAGILTMALLSGPAGLAQGRKSTRTTSSDADSS